MTDVKDLVTIDDGVRGDDTMKDMYQLLRVDLVRAPTVKAQILYSRIPKELYFSHKIGSVKKRMNVGYISYSKPEDLFSLARSLFASGIAVMLARSMPFFSSGLVDLDNAVRKNLLTQIKVIKELTEAYMKGLK